MIDPIFSIVIPTYNSSTTIKECVNSILTQTLTNFEILIIDGISKDKTLSIVEKFNDERIMITCEKDNGIYDAMNKGILKSKGDWILFLGSDDKLFDENVLEDISKYIKKNTFDIIYGKVLFANSNMVYGELFTLDKLLFEKNLCHQSIFYKKTVFEKNGFYNHKYLLWADWEFNIRCFRNTLNKTLFYDRIIALYNDGLGKSGQKEDEQFKKELPVFYKFKIKELEDELSLIKSRNMYFIDLFIRRSIKLFR